MTSVVKPVVQSTTTHTTSSSLQARARQPPLMSPVSDTSLVFSEFDFSTATPERIQRLNELWAEGFRVIVPLYWREINWSWQVTPFIVLGSAACAVVVMLCWVVFTGAYSTATTAIATESPASWGSTIAAIFTAAVWGDSLWSLLLVFLAILPIYPAQQYISMHRNVEAFIKKNGVKPDHVHYDKFFICEYDNYIIACVGVKEGETLEGPAAAAGTTTDKDAATATPRVMSVWRLTVDPAFRKYGLGRKMMQLCEDYAVEEKYDTIKLLAGNIASIRFYERLNYDVDRVAWSSGRHVSLYFKKDLTNKHNAVAAGGAAGVAGAAGVDADSTVQSKNKQD